MGIHVVTFKDDHYIESTSSAFNLFACHSIIYLQHVGKTRSLLVVDTISVMSVDIFKYKMFNTEKRMIARHAFSTKTGKFSFS